MMVKFFDQPYVLYVDSLLLTKIESSTVLTLRTNSYRLIIFANKFRQLNNKKYEIVA